MHGLLLSFLPAPCLSTGLLARTKGRINAGHGVGVRDTTEPPAGPDLKVETGTASLPRPGSKGEDAVTVRRMRERNRVMAAVADGVGGWKEEGVDPSEFSESLVRFAEAYAETFSDPFFVISCAHNSTKGPGSSTLSVAMVEEGKLRVGNLGDSGILLIRSGKVAYRTKAQVHAFNLPLQLSDPEVTPSDGASQAEVKTLSLEPGDRVVLCSDGVLDNLWEEEIVRAAGSSKLSSQEAAESLAWEARKASQDETRESPFVKEAKRSGWAVSQLGISGLLLKGGKVDDIAVAILSVY